MEGLINEFGIWGLVGAAIVVGLFIYGFSAKASGRNTGGSGDSSSSNNSEGGE